MSGTAQPGAAPPGAFGPPAWAPNPLGPGGHRGWNPWAFAWSLPKPVLIGAMVLAFILFWPIGLAVLFFLIGTGRIGGRWARRNGHAGAAWTGAGAGDCGWRGWRREEGASSGNAAFDEYRQDTLRRLEEEQRDFAAFLERLRFAKDKAEFDQFMDDRARKARPATDDTQDDAA